jgi:ABC-type nitrate/sulfonate/bicarbonate transport system substrate-binding protein
MQVVFSKCPVGAATEIIMRNGALIDMIDRSGGEFTLLQSMAPEFQKAHFTQEAPLHFRDGGNMPPIWAQSIADRSVLLGATRQYERVGLFVKADSQISEVSQLKGRRIAIPIREKAVFDFRRYTAIRGVETLLGFYGLTPGDVEYVPVKCTDAPPRRISGFTVQTKDTDFLTQDVLAVLDGDADAVFCNSIKAVRHADAGLMKNLIPEEGQIPRTYVNNNSCLLITCTKPFAYDHPEIVITYLRELFKAADWAAENRDAFLETVSHGVYDADPAECARSFSENVHKLRRPAMTDELLALADSQKIFLLRQGALEKDFDILRWADGSFLEEALKAY